MPDSPGAEGIIKVLMIEGPHTPLPSENVRRKGNLHGKVFINGRVYSGDIDILSDEKGLYIVTNLPFERYIEGVVASEVSSEWEMEALKAQAVASRTYAAFYKSLNAGKAFHLTSSVLHQAYRGKNIDPMIKLAVERTRGEILLYDGRPIKALYHSTCAGKTELPEEVWGERYPYLRSVDCNSRGSPYENWQREFTFDEISSATGINGLKYIEIASHTSTGRVRSLRLYTTDGQSPVVELKATDFRRILGYRRLPSTQFSLRNIGNGIIINGSGWGHGVGLCQWGALEMARQGKDYREILAHYYPGAMIKKW